MVAVGDDSPYTSLRISSSLDIDRHREGRGHNSASESFLKPQNIYYPSDDSIPPSKKAISLARRSQLEIVLAWIRWMVIVLLQCFIIILLLPASGIMGDDGWAGKLVGGLKNGSGSTMCAKAGGANCTEGGSTAHKPWNLDVTEVGGDVNGLFVSKSKTHYIIKLEEDKFIPSMTTNSTRMQIRANWDNLLPLGSGFVSIPDSKSYPRLGNPITDDPMHNGTLFEASWTHAIRCLYSTMDSYHQLLLSNGSSYDILGEHAAKNATQCFEYLRSYVLCTADMALEGDRNADGTSNGSNSGHSHMCRDRDQAIRWIEERRVNDIRSITGVS